MTTSMGLEHVGCYCCGSRDGSAWGTESGYRAIKCTGCGLVYVSPRPSQEAIDEAARTGQHATERGEMSLTGRYRQSRVRRHTRVISAIFSDFASRNELRWLDIGAGFGELLKAVKQVFPSAETAGFEPNDVKRRMANEHGVVLTGGRLADLPKGHYDVVSLMNVWSHLPDPAAFLDETRTFLRDGGRVLIQTGSGGELATSKDYPDALLLPDHLSFAGESHIRQILERARYEVEAVSRRREDTFQFAAARAAKVLLRRNGRIVVPYRSPFRTIYVRAALARR